MKSIENKYKKTKTNVIHSINNKEIASYLKDLSDNLSCLIKKDKSLIEKENSYEKYETAYDSMFDQEYTNYNNNHILFIGLITFHHKLGGVIECTFPKKEELISSEKINELIPSDNEKFKTTESVLEFISNNLVNYCLMDGIHLINKDTNFFDIHEFSKPIYCLSYYIQKKTDNDKNKIEDDFQENIRGCIQKSICIVSTLPIFGNVNVYQNYYTHSLNQMTLYMNQRSLNDKTALTDIYDKLLNEFNHNKKWLFNIRKAFLMFKEDLLIILKLIALEKRVIIFSQIPSNVSLLIMTLLSFFPGNYSDGKQPFDEQNGTPLRIFHGRYLIFPLFTLFDLDSLLNKIKSEKEINFLLGTTNKIIIENKSLNYCCLINIDEQKIQYGQGVYEDTKKINGREMKLVKAIYSLINEDKDKDKDKDKDNKEKDNKDKEKANKDQINIIEEKNNTTRKKNRINEDWIIVYNEEEGKLFYNIKKYILSYYLKIIYDIGYLIKEIQYNIKNDPFNIKLVNFYENLQMNYLKSTDPNFQGVGDKNNNDLFKEDDILPKLENIISDPSTYTICSILPIKISNISVPKKTHIEKKRESILVKINNLSFISLWTKTKNFKKWYCSYKEQIVNYSTLNIETTKTELYDYDNNLYKGPMTFGKKEGIGTFDFKKLKMRYDGQFKNDLREGNGTLVSYDEKFYYEGEWVNNKMEGQGVLYSSQLGKYSGKFHNDFFEGHGSLIDVEDNMYEGNFHKGEKCGKGELKLSDGKVYFGEFKGDKYHGKGIIKDSNGTVLMEGEFKKGFLTKYKKGSKKEKNIEKVNTQQSGKRFDRRKSLNPLAEEVNAIESIIFNDEDDENENENEEDA